MNKRPSVKHIWQGLVLAVLLWGSTASPQSWTSYTNYNQVKKLTADPASPRLWGATTGGAVLFSWQDTTLVEKYDNTNGLPSVELTSMALGRHGFKWFGTYGGGIARLDSAGSSWRVLNAIDGLLSDTVTALCSYQDYIFAGTRQGLSFSNDGDSWPGISNDLIFPNLQSINSIAQRNDTIWIATDVGLAKAAASYFASHIPPSWQRDSVFGLSSRNVQCIFLSDSSSFIGTMSGADSLEGNIWRPIANLNGLIVRDIVNKGDSLFFATSQGIRVSYQGVWTSLSAGLISTNAYSLALDGLGRLWCGTELGLAVLQGGAWKPYRFNCITENNCYRVACHQAGDPYIIRLSQKEIQYFLNGQWQTYDQANTGMPFNDLRDLAFDKFGRLYAGDWGSGLFVCELNGSWRQYLSALPAPVVRDILPTEQGLYLGQWRSDERDPICFYSFADTLMHPIWSPAEKRFRPLSLVMGNDNSLWVGTFELGLYHRQTDGSWQNFNNTNSGLPNSPVNALCHEGSGRLWVGTDNGLFYYDGREITLYPQTLLSGTIRSLAIDRANNKWVGTDKGLNLITWDGKVLFFTQRDMGNNGSRLLSDNINDIAIVPIDDQADGIYIATEGGLNLISYNLVLTRQVLSVNVAPNPYRPGHDPYFYFSNLPSRALVRIYTLDGRLWGSFDGPEAPQHILAVNPNEIGSKLVSGLYLCHISAPGFKQTVCKLAVIR